MKQILRVGLGNPKIVKEAANPCREDPEHNQNEQRRADIVHDGLEVALVLRPLDELRRAADEGVLGRVDDNGVRLSALAASSVVDEVAEVLIDGQGLTGDGRLVDGHEGGAAEVLGRLRDYRGAAFPLILVVVGIACFVADMSEAVFGPESKIYLKVVRAVVIANEPRISSYSVAFLNQDLRTPHR